MSSIIYGHPAVLGKNIVSNQNEEINSDDRCLFTIDYLDAIGKNKISGHEPFRSFGQRLAVSTAVNGDDIWEGTATTIPIPSSLGEQMTLVSSSVNDTNGGTGVNSVDIHYIDTNGVAQREIKTLSGTTPVNTVATNIRFVQSIHSETVGSNGVAVGNISIYKTGFAATVYNIIVAGGNMSLSTAKMIPAGKTYYLKDLSICAASNKPISIRLRATATFEDTLTDGLFFLYKSTWFLQNTTVVKNYSMPLIFPSLSIIKLTAYSVTAGGDISCGYDGWIEDNE